VGKHKRLSGKQIIKTVEQMGFVQARQRGSHVVMKKISADGAVGCVVPMHNEVATGTLHALLKQAKVAIDDFEQNI
jgi:predicted RNA binding protein YcfA (HicA-like mRNA interferase family)